MRNAFVCCTPYHVILSVHMAKNVLTNEENDIFISDHFGNAYDIYLRLKEFNVFKNLYFVRDKDISHDGSFLKKKKIIRYLCRKYEDITEPSCNYIYDKLYLFTYSFFSVLITDLVKFHNSRAKVYLVEEGLMTYLLSTNNYKEKIKNVIDKLGRLFNRRFLCAEMVDGILLFKPELYTGDVCRDKLRKIPDIMLDYNFKILLNNIFGYLKQSDFNYFDYIFFDQCFSIDKNNQLNEANIIKQVLDVTGRDQLLVKLHPRDAEDKYKNIDIKNTNKSSFPWEIIILNENLENKTLVSVNSSALFSSKIVFNKNNNIILLYRLFGLKQKNIEKLIEKMKINYPEWKIYIPENLIDLQNIVNIKSTTR